MTTQIRKNMAGAPFKPSFGLGGVVDLGVGAGVGAGVGVGVGVGIGAPYLPSFGRCGSVDLDLVLDLDLDVDLGLAFNLRNLRNLCNLLPPSLRSPLQ